LCVDKILINIEKMDNEEREKLLILIKEKYNLMDKLPEDAFIVGSSYDFWLCEEDDIYDKQIYEPKKSSSISK